MLIIYCLFIIYSDIIQQCGCSFPELLLVSNGILNKTFDEYSLC